MTNRLETIWRKIDVRGPDECWEWKGYRNRGAHSQKGPGYGRLDILGFKGVYAHRAAYLAANPGAITLSTKDGKLVLHRCDNPGCCNPAHLFIGTHADNVADMLAKERQTTYTSIESPRAKLSADEVREIRELAIRNGGTWTKPQLAARYGVSEVTIKSVLSGRHYADVI